MDQKRPKDIEDQQGWFCGIRASLKAVFGTDMELHIRHDGMQSVTDQARKEVGRMSAASELLLRSLNGRGPMDSTEQALEAIIKDL